MYQVDEKPETIHLYVVREEAARPSLLPVVLSLFTLSLLLILAIATPYTQPVTRFALRVPAVPLGVRSFSASVAIIPTGVRTHPATTAHGILTFTNGSVIAQAIPQGFVIQNVITDRAVYVPAGSANGYGVATVPAHMLMAGSNLPTLAINQVIGTSLYIRNLSPFIGGHPAYSVKYVTPQDKQAAVTQARSVLMGTITGLHEPCAETVSGSITLTWRCQFVTYRIPTFYHVTDVRIIGKNLLLNVWFVARPIHVWVK